MHDLRGTIRWCRYCAAVVWSLVLTCTHIAAAEILLAPANMPRIGSIDERFQSYNIEMVEVTGGPVLETIWRAPQRRPSRPFFGAKPIDLGDARLRSLAAAPVTCLYARQWKLGKCGLLCGIG